MVHDAPVGATLVVARRRAVHGANKGRPYRKAGKTSLPNNSIELMTFSWGMVSV